MTAKDYKILAAALRSMVEQHDNRESVGDITLNIHHVIARLTAVLSLNYPNFNPVTFSNLVYDKKKVGR